MNPTMKVTKVLFLDGERVKRTAASLDLPMDQIAGVLGVSPASLSTCLRGIAPMPVAMLNKLTLYMAAAQEVGQPPPVPEPLARALRVRERYFELLKDSAENGKPSHIPSPLVAPVGP